MIQQYQLFCDLKEVGGLREFYGCIGPDDVDYAMMLILSREYLALYAEQLVTDVRRVEESSDPEVDTVELCVAQDGTRSLKLQLVDNRKRHWFGIVPYQERRVSTPITVTAEPVWHFSALPDWSDAELAVADMLEKQFAELR